MATTATSPTGAGVTTSLIIWMKSLFGKAFTVSRGYSPPGVKNFHDGVDLPAALGTPVYALRAGVVTYAKNAGSDKNAGNNWAIGGGNVVNIDVGGKLTTQYAHLNSLLVKEGQLVSQGQQIGTVGKTGFSIGRPHLHFGLWDRSSNTMINPDNFLKGVGDTTADLNPFDWSPDRVLSKADLTKLSDYLYAIEIDPSKKAGWKQYLDVFFFPNPIASPNNTNFEGKKFSDLQATQGYGKLFDKATIEDSIGGGLDIGQAIEDVGNQVTDTFTWVGFIFVGAIILIGGILLMMKSND